MKRSQPVQVLDFSYMDYDLDQYELKLYELHPLVDYFLAFESTVAENGVRKPLLWARNKNKFRFSQFSEKMIYISVDDSAIFTQILTEVVRDRTSDKESGSADSMFDLLQGLEQSTKSSLMNRLWIHASG